MNKHFKYDIDVVVVVVGEEDIFKTFKCFIFIDFSTRVHA